MTPDGRWLAGTGSTLLLSNRRPQKAILQNTPAQQHDEQAKNLIHLEHIIEYERRMRDHVLTDCRSIQTTNAETFEFLEDTESFA